MHQCKLTGTCCFRGLHFLQFRERGKSCKIKLKLIRMNIRDMYQLTATK